MSGEGTKIDAMLEMMKELKNDFRQMRKENEGRDKAIHHLTAQVGQLAIEVAELKKLVTALAKPEAIVASPKAGKLKRRSAKT